MQTTPTDIPMGPGYYYEDTPARVWPNVNIRPDDERNRHDNYAPPWTAMDVKHPPQNSNAAREPDPQEPTARPRLQSADQDENEPAHPPKPSTHMHRSRGRLKHVDRFVDRGGTVRHYYRRGGGRRIALPGVPGSPEFNEAHAEAAHWSGLEFLHKIREREEAGTLELLLKTYLAAAYFDGVSDATLHTHKRVLKGWLAADKVGRRQVSVLGPKSVQAMMQRRAATPAAANDLLRRISQLMRFAVDNGWRADDPTRKVRRFKRGTARRSWTSTEQDAFQAMWPISTVAGRAFVRLLRTGNRPKDIVRLTWTELAAGDGGVDTLEGLKRREQGDGFVLTTARGKPFSAHGFVNFFSAAVRATNLPADCVAGGLRKSWTKLSPTAFVLHASKPGLTQVASQPPTGGTSHAPY